MNRTHDELIELTGAYALDALEPDEAEVMDLHLRECPRCRTEVEEHRDTAAHLAHVGIDAPPALWERIAGALESAPLEIERIFPIAEPRRKSRRLLVTGMAAAIAAVIAVNGAILVRQNRQIDRLEHENAQQIDLERVALAAAADPLARVASIKSSDGKRRADAIVLPDGRGYLINHDLPDLDDKHTYQLWGRVAGVDRPISFGILGSSPKVVAFSATAPLQRMGISIEPAGGSPAPTGDGAGSGDVLART